MSFEATVDKIITGTKSLIYKALQPIERRLSELEKVDVDAIVENRILRHMVDTESRIRDAVEKEVARIPKPADGKDGRDGKDAIELESFECSLSEDGRTMTISFRSGEDVYSKSIRMPTMLYKGVFSRGTEYSENDVVTYGGSMFIAMKDAPEGAPGTSDDWRLSVKRGRDGKDGRNGIDTTGKTKLEVR